MTTELLEAPPVATELPKLTHGEVMRDVEALFEREYGKPHRTVYAYGNTVEVVTFATGKEKVVYTTATIPDARTYCDRNGLACTVVDIRRLGKKWY